MCLTVSDCVYSQSEINGDLQQNVTNRKKVGLVLSGGGAKGLAHIGVLKALEEYNIPIDYIAGTSMGAIIGGLYASGYSPEDIERIFYSDEFNDWLSRKIDDKYRYYYMRQRNDATLLNMGFDISKGLKAEIPLSLINPIQMDFAFMQFFASANEICNGDYDKLMLPFFCIASDIGSKKQSVQRKGMLYKSIRASMTFPFFFSPISIDGNLMCDGGLYNNFPSIEMDSFYFPDVMLGVKVVDNFDEPNDEDIVLYIENMVTVDSRYEMPTASSVMIEPNMKFVSIMDFSMKDECIRRGYQTAVANIKKIRNLVQDSITQEQRSAQRDEFNNKKKPLTIGNILVHGVNKSVQTHIDRLMLMNIKKDSITLDDLKFNYLNVASLPNIKNIESNIYYDNFLKKYVLDLNVRTKNILQARIGGMLSTDPVSNLFAGLEYNFFHRYSYKIGINGYFGRYYSSMGIYYRMDFPNKVLPFYIDAQVNINRWNYFRNRNGLFEYSATNYLVQRENNMQLRVGIPIKRISKFEVKLGRGQTNDEYFNKNVILSTDTNDVTKFDNFVTGSLFELNTLDDIMFPLVGHYVRFHIQYISGKERFFYGNTYANGVQVYDSEEQYNRHHNWVQFDLQTKFFGDISKYYSFGILTHTHYSLQDLFYTQKASLLNSASFTPTLETFTRFYPEYRTNQFFSLGTEQILKTGESFLGSLQLRLGIYAFLPVREILSNDYNQPYYGELFQRVYSIGALSLISRTPIGNIVLALSYTQRNNTHLNPWNISLSFGKTVFNNKNISR